MMRKGISTLVLLLASVTASANTLQLLPSIYQDGPQKSITASKGVTKLAFSLKEVQYKDVNLAGQNLASIDGVTSFIEGAPKIPFISVVVEMEASLVNVDQLNLGTEVLVDGFIPTPAAAEPCRCPTEPEEEAKIDSYKYGQGLVKVESLGDFRGKALSRVTLYPALVDLGAGQTKFYPEVELVINAKRFDPSESFNLKTNNKKFLMVYPKSLESSVKVFAQWKLDNGFEVELKALEDIKSNATADDLKKFFYARYKATSYKYALIFGTEALVPMHQVDTSGSRDTPSDQPNYLFGSNADYIPDVFAGRIAASTNDDVLQQLHKFQAYQSETYPVGLKAAIGIASNEGQNPSDEEYIRSIEKEFGNAYGFSFTHFAQNDLDSRPEVINDTFANGVNWLTYMGHGSGTSWASTNITYTVKDIKDMNNAKVNKPVFIDVACMNGKIEKGYAGERLMNEVDGNGDPIGTTMYYGGTVNISWHPPAIMAKGMAIKTVNQGLTNISEIIFAGQLYLSENYNDQTGIVDNFEWYHLFGDPSLDIKF